MNNRQKKKNDELRASPTETMTKLETPITSDRRKPKADFHIGWTATATLYNGTRVTGIVQRMVASSSGCRVVIWDGTSDIEVWIDQIEQAKRS